MLNTQALVWFPRQCTWASSFCGRRGIRPGNVEWRIELMIILRGERSPIAFHGASDGQEAISETLLVLVSSKFNCVCFLW